MTKFFRAGSVGDAYSLGAMANKNRIGTTDLASALRELEHIAAEIESGRLGLEEGLQKYQRGNALLRHARSVLERAENTVSRLVPRERRRLAS